ncbi:hypothetical protein V5O48_009991 [Marasmius crinis-equi]|uniref:Uncharacterized protein n=1 Tax=Marasmius crinis-equi TaxID=585013 RepID=A0ABR3F9P8_9AGAR
MSVIVELIIRYNARKFASIAQLDRKVFAERLRRDLDVLKLPHPPMANIKDISQDGIRFFWEPMPTNAPLHTLVKSVVLNQDEPEISERKRACGVELINLKVEKTRTSASDRMKRKRERDSPPTKPSRPYQRRRSRSYSRSPPRHRSARRSRSRSLDSGQGTVSKPHETHRLPLRSSHYVLDEKYPPPPRNERISRSWSHSPPRHGEPSRMMGRELYLPPEVHQKRGRFPTRPTHGKANHLDRMISDTTSLREANRARSPSLPDPGSRNTDGQARSHQRRRSRSPPSREPPRGPGTRRSFSPGAFDTGYLSSTGKVDSMRGLPVGYDFNTRQASRRSDPKPPRSVVKIEDIQASLMTISNSLTSEYLSDDDQESPQRTPSEESLPLPPAPTFLPKPPPLQLSPTAPNPASPSPSPPISTPPVASFISRGPPSLASPLPLPDPPTSFNDVTKVSATRSPSILPPIITRTSDVQKPAVELPTPPASALPTVPPTLASDHQVSTPSASSQDPPMPLKSSPRILLNSDAAQCSSTGNIGTRSSDTVTRSASSVVLSSSRMPETADGLAPKFNPISQTAYEKPRWKPISLRPRAQPSEATDSRNPEPIPVAPAIQQDKDVVAKLTRQLWDTRRNLMALSARGLAIENTLREMKKQEESRGIDKGFAQACDKLDIGAKKVGSWELQFKLKIMEGLLKEETRARMRAEMILADVLRECEEPSVVPKLYEMMVDVLGVEQETDAPMQTDSPDT